MTPTNTQGSEQATADPNEVMDVEMIKEQAKLFAKDFLIPYDKISVRKGKFVSFKRDADSDFSGTVGNPAVTVELWLISRHYELVAQQNAALLRELRNREIQIDGVWAVPSYILEAKAEELEKQL